MKAVMLAAGIGRRLYGDDGTEPPKSLLEFGGKTLLSRHIETLRLLGVEELVLVLGYKKDVIWSEIEALGAGNFVSSVENPRFREGSILSLQAANGALRGGDDVLFMDADVLHHPDILERMVRSPAENCIPLDRDFEDGDEPVKVCFGNGDLVDFGKSVEGDFDTVGEWVGFLKLSSPIAAALADAAEETILRLGSDTTSEEAMRHLFISQPPATFGYEDVTGIPWIEIDFPEDVERARTVILPKIPG
jgi:choline kinase